MATTYTTTCEQCGKSIRFKATLVGRIAKCPGCESKITLSDAATIDVASEALNKDKQIVTKKVVSSQASKPTEPTGESTTESIGKYRLKRRLGRGGFGEVWEALDTNLGRTVAIKLPHFLPTDRKKIERFLREGRSAAQLRHPNIVGVYDAGVIDEQHFLAIELVDGKPLSDYDTDRQLEHHAIARMVADLAKAMQYAHNHGIIHRDIKPQNIVVRTDGRAQILDFGLAKSMDESVGLTLDGSVLGTPAYMSPEQARGDIANVGPASDQYSLGATLYWMLTGEAMFSGPSHVIIASVISKDVTPAISINPKIDPRLNAICMKATAKLAKDRYASCDGFAQDLNRYLNDESVIARPFSFKTKAVRWIGRNRTEAILMIASFAALVAFASISMLGYFNAAGQLKTANEIDAKLSQELAKIDANRKALQIQLDRTKSLKERSEIARVQLNASQKESEAAMLSLQETIAANQKIQYDSQKQLTIINDNSAAVTVQETVLTENEQQIRDQSVAKWLAMDEVGRESRKRTIHSNVANLMAATNWTESARELATIPEQLRDNRYKFQKYWIENNGIPASAIKRWDVIPGLKTLLRKDISVQGIDSVDKTIKLYADGEFIWIDYETLKVLAKYQLDETDRIETFDNQPANRLQITKSPKNAVYDKSTQRVILFQNVQYKKSDINYRVSHIEVESEVWFVDAKEKARSQGRYPGEIKMVFFSTLGVPFAIFETFDAANAFGQVPNDFQSRFAEKANPSFHLSKLHTKSTVVWDYVDEKQQFPKELFEDEIASATSWAAMCLHLSTDHTDYLPFEIYDSKLKKNIFGLFTLNETKNLVQYKWIDRENTKMFNDRWRVPSNFRPTHPAIASPLWEGQATVPAVGVIAWTDHDSVIFESLSTSAISDRIFRPNDGATRSRFITMALFSTGYTITPMRCQSNLLTLDGAAFLHIPDGLQGFQAACSEIADVIMIWNSECFAIIITPLSINESSNTSTSR
jgi:serine/threonine protein kinase